MTRVRVLHLIDQLTDGGSQRWVWDIVRLSDRAAVEHRVHPIMLDRGDFVYADRLANAGVYRHSIFRPFLKGMEGSRPRLSSPPIGQPGRLSSIVAKVWRAANFARACAVLPMATSHFRPDVIHAHTFHSLIAALALRKMFKVPVIHTVPALVSQMRDIGAGWLADMYRSRQEEIDLFFTGASRSDLEEAGVPKRKVQWISGVVDTQEIAQVMKHRPEHRARVRAEIGANQDAPIALSVGRVHPSKGHRYALDALPAMLARHPGLHWIVLGIGPEMGELQQRAKELEVADRVHFPGFVNDPLPYYAAADIYLRTPVYEAENLCSYQAMAAAVPVVGFDTRVETELIPTAGHGVLVPNKDALALADEAATILALPDRGRTLGQRGAVYAEAHLDIRNTIAQYTAAYRRIADTTAHELNPVTSS